LPKNAVKKTSHRGILMKSLDVLQDLSENGKPNPGDHQPGILLAGFLPLDARYM